LKTILVLEDEPVVMTLLGHVLKLYGVTSATTADQALQHFKKRPGQPDLLLADVTLKVSSGVQVALILRSELPDLAVVLFSGYPVSGWNDRDFADFQRLGWHSLAVLQKPFEAKLLSNAVFDLIGSPQSNKAITR
jgi:CheY-like chemotaxis protein